MKQFFISIFMSIVLSAGFSLNCLADNSKTVTILYSGNIMGHITPVRG